MTIETSERLIIRELVIDDGEFILKLLNEPSFIQNIADRGVRTLADAQTYIQNGPMANYQKFGFGLWAVTLKADHSLLGICGLIKREYLEDIDIGYAFLPQFWHQGYASEAAQAVIEYARTKMALSRLAAIVNPANSSSIRLLEKLGFSFVKMIRISDSSQEICLFSMIF